MLLGRPPESCFFELENCLTTLKYLATVFEGKIAKKKSQEEIRHHRFLDPLKLYEMVYFLPLALK